MKEDRTAVLTRASEASARRPQTGEANSAADPGSTAPEIHSHTSEVVLFLLDLARTTGNSCFMLLAKDAATQLTRKWCDFICEALPHSADLSLKGYLSNSAFALAEAWKVTREPVYRQAGLEILHRISEIEARASGCVSTAHQERRR
jgi:hypothetical protein